MPKERKVLIIGNKRNNTSIFFYENQDPSILSNFLEIEKAEQIYDFSSKLNESEFYEPSKKGEQRRLLYK